MKIKSSFYKFDGEWCFNGTDEELGYNFQADNWQDAMEHINAEGWKLVNILHNPKYDDANEYIVEKLYIHEIVNDAERYQESLKRILRLTKEISNGDIERLISLMKGYAREALCPWVYEEDDK